MRAAHSLHSFNVTETKLVTGRLRTDTRFYFSWQEHILSPQRFIFYSDHAPQKEDTTKNHFPSNKTFCLSNAKLRA